MFGIIDSPVLKTIPSGPFENVHNNRPRYERHSSVDEQCNFKSQFNQISLRAINQKQDKRISIVEKTGRTEKQRAYSQKKLTLTSPNQPNWAIKNKVSQTPIPALLNARQAYEGFKENMQMKSLNSNKTAPLQKKGKYTTLKNSQTVRFPSSTSNIYIESAPFIQQKQKQNEEQNQYTQAQKQKSIALINQTNKLNYYASNPQHLYRHEAAYTAPNSPFQTGHHKINLDLDSKNILRDHTNNNNVFFKQCKQKIQEYKQQSNKVLAQNSMKIKHLESLLLRNRQQIDSKNQKIRQLQLTLVLKQNSFNKPKYQGSTSSHVLLMALQNLSGPVDYNGIKNQNSEYLISKIADLEKKIQIISKFSNDPQSLMDQKIDKMNSFLYSFITVKFHNLKFTLKTFVQKNQKRVAQMEGKTSRIQEIVKLNNLQGYEGLLQKAKGILSVLQKDPKPKTVQKIGVENMKTTVDTAVSSLKNKHNQVEFKNMCDSRDRNDSFWNNLQDVSACVDKNSEQSFTDDSFSYAPKSLNLNFSSNNNSPESQYALGSFPSFSKTLTDINSGKQSAFLADFPALPIDSSFIDTLQQIAKYRQGPVNIYIDQNGSIRYKGSDSYIFDKRGNILKPTQAEMQYCFGRNWIICK